MFFRVTQSQMADLSQMYLAKQTSELYRVQKQISSGLKIQRPSDDPAGMRRSLIQKDRLDRLEAHETSIQHVKSRLEQAHVQLREANSLMTRVREIALQAPQTTDDSEVQVLVRELDGISEQLASVANSRDESGYLFSGTSADALPFPDVSGTSGLSSYAGTSAETQLLLPGEDPRHAMIPGDRIFQPLDRQTTVLTGRSGTAVGSGTDTARGQRSLIISHTLTTYAAGSGVTAGNSSVASDTVIGASGTHQLVINDTSGTGTSGTISLNGGASVAFSNTDTDLMVTGPNGEKVYLNTTAITPGFSGTVDMTADGTLSIDGGLSSTAITFSANQQVVDSRDGSLVNLNTTGTKMAGTDEMEFPGTSDIFAVVHQLREDLLNSRNMETSARADSLNRRLADVEQIQDHLLDMVGIQSVSMEQMERLQTRTGDLKLAEKSDYSDTVSADISEAVLRLQELNNLQQFTMAAVTKLISPNLLTYLQ